MLRFAQQKSTQNITQHHAFHLISWPHWVLLILYMQGRLNRLISCILQIKLAARFLI